MEIVAFVRNLLFLDKLISAAQSRGDTIRTAQCGTLSPADLVVVDLAEPGWEAIAQEAREGGLPVLAFGPHIRSELFAAARDLGVSRAVANSQFAQSLPGLLADVGEPPRSDRK